MGLTNTCHVVPNWDYDLILKEGEILKSLLGDIHNDSMKLSRFYEKNSLTLYSPDNYEAVTIVFTPSGQMLRHYYNSKEAVIENIVRVLDVWRRYLDSASAVDVLTNEIQILLDMRFSQRVSQKRLF
jgi:hypothetical protein